ncbi:hypothetical protein PIB30_040908 [Stylosanthes scabra]|uniref:Uncharacterized protein n=1 Tax=Stylosanthes scabra TaxID=79078 RepID=A0ABU6WCW6_9FABA|nr:hypothetical protein [Stylosanthes scabra]
MLIYHDYHGDSKISSISSISTWDQIQISLKCLLPSYQPILFDSAVVSSFLSDQKQQQICVDFEQTYSRIITTMNKFIQEDEADPKLESNLAENVEELENSNQQIQIQQFKTQNMKSSQDDEDEDELDARTLNGDR